MTTEVAPDTTLGRYQLSRILASGGIAEVFLARAEGPAGFEKSLVIKRIRPELVQNGEFVELFLREARAAAQLDHPNCVQIFDFGEVEGTYYLAMELIEGLTLRQVVDAAPGRRLPLSLAARIVTLVCEGLAFAHEHGHGTVHGNVSPEHVMLARNGGVKVIDFGVSRVANLVAGTAAGTVMGRVGYQPVEQLLDEPDPRADIYALGVMLYELGAGATPYPQLPTQQLFDTILGEPPVPLGQLVPDIDQTYAAIVDRAMAREADDRYADCRELEADLADFIRSTGERVGTVQLVQLVTGGVGAVVLTPPRPSAPRPADGYGEAVHLDDFDVAVSDSGPAIPAPQESAPSVVAGVLESAPSVVTGQLVSSSSIVPGTPVSSTSSLTMDLAEPAPEGGLFANIGQVAVAPAHAAPPAGGLFANIGQVAVAPTHTAPEQPEHPSYGGFFPSAPMATGGYGAQTYGAQDAAPMGTGGYGAQTYGAQDAAPPAYGGYGAQTYGAQDAAPRAPGAGAAQDPGVSAPPSPFGGFFAGAPSPDPSQSPFGGFFQGAAPVEAAPQAVGGFDARASPGADAASGGAAASHSAYSAFFGGAPAARQPAPPPPSHDPRFAAPPAPSAPRAASSPAAAPPPPSAPPSAPGGFFDGPASAPPPPSRPSAPSRPAAPARASAPPPPTRGSGHAPGGMDAETRAQAVLASAKAMRTFDAGPVLGSPQELDVIRTEVERDEGALLLVRFALNAARLKQANPELRELLAERLAGVVFGLLLAEAYTPLAGVLERLDAGAKDDAELRWVAETMRASLCTPDQVARLGARLRELAPADAAGLGRVIGQFGGDFAPAWIAVYEAMELPGSREAMQPGLAALASKNPVPFVQRVDVKRPRRLAEFAYFLEKGRGADRHRVFKELLTRGEPVRRRDVLAGMAQAGSEDGLRLVTQALGEADEESRIHAVQLLSKHFPDKAFALAQPLLDDSYDERSLAERQALWRALGGSGHAEVVAGMAEVLRRKSTLLNRGKLEARKLDVLEGVAELKRAEGPALFEAVIADRSQPDAVRAAAQRLLAAHRAAQRTVEPVEARRWERTPSTWRDVLIDLGELAEVARLLEVTSPLLETSFARLKVRVETLLKVQAPAVFSVAAGTISVNESDLGSGDSDASMPRIVAAFAKRGVTGFSITAPLAVDELQQLVRWLALGPAARTVTTPRVQRAFAPGFEQLPALPPVSVNAAAEPSKEALTRYAALVLELRGYLAQRNAGATTPPPELRGPLHELALLLHSRTVRFLGLAPATAAADSLVFHTVNTLVLALGFGAELGLSKDRLVALAEWALYSDAGQLELVEVLSRGAQPSKDDLARMRRASLKLPFERQPDLPATVRWAGIVVDQEKAAGAEHGLLGDLVALARAWEGLTSTQAPEAALEALTTRLAGRFRPELLALFVRYAKRQAWRPLQQQRR